MEAVAVDKSQVVQGQNHVEKYFAPMHSASHQLDCGNYGFNNAIIEMTIAKIDRTVERMTGIHILRISIGINSSSATPAGKILYWSVAS